MATKEMKIEGMTCLHCEKTVAEALASVGASRVEADWREGRAVFDAGAAPVTRDVSKLSCCAA